MSERFFLETPPRDGVARLTGTEAQHVSKVMRAKVGDEVTVFDGSGSEFLAVVASISRQAVELRVVEQHEVNRELTCKVTLAVALPKGDRQQWLVEKLTEIGVTRLVPIVCQRSVAQPVEAALARMQRWVIEASKQCGRNRLMEIAAPEPWLRYLKSAPPGVRVIAHTSDAPASASFDEQVDFTAAIGPEGGWTDEEVAAAIASGWKLVSLGPRILRLETAAIVLASLASQRLP
jgi:16S rRNA (uracil1498-N3)-methyltransferase